MKSPAALRLVAPLCTLLLAACGGGGGDAPPVTTPPQPSISFGVVPATFTRDRAASSVLSSVFVDVHNARSGSLWITGSYSKAGITSVTINAADPTTFQITFALRPPTTIYNGTYHDTMTFITCVDQACTQPLVGSPMVIPITYTVTGTDPVTGATGPLPDTGVTPFVPASRVALTHDVVDAEYDRSLDRIVMVGRFPANALYVYDPATGTEKSAALALRPTAVSVSPDGLTAAVGHAGKVSVVDLTTVGQLAAQPPRQVTVTGTVFDLVLDGQNRVHYLPFTLDSEFLYTVDLATGANHFENLFAAVQGPGYLRLHPSGNSVFLGDANLSPGQIAKWDITGAAAHRVNTGSFGNGGGCGKLWISDVGDRVYSQCGYVLGTDGPLGNGLPLQGQMVLSSSPGFMIEWMEQWSPTHEIALVQDNASACDLPEFGVPCYSRVALFDSGTLQQLSVAALAPQDVNGTLHAQRGLFVFYKADGSHKYLLSQLDAMDTPVGAYFISVLP
jgi:hypothetical protein